MVDYLGILWMRPSPKWLKAMVTCMDLSLVYESLWPKSITCKLNIQVKEKSITCERYVGCTYLIHIYLIVMSEVIVGDGDCSGTQDSINQTICAVRQRVVVHPNVARTKDGNSITIGHGSPAVMRRGAADHGIPSGFAVMDVETVDDDIGDKLNGYAGAVGNVYGGPSTINGFEAVHYELLLESNDHVALEGDPEWFVLDDGVAESSRPRVHWIVITGVSDDVVAAIPAATALRPKPMPQSASLLRLRCHCESQRQQSSMGLPVPQERYPSDRRAVLLLMLLHKQIFVRIIHSVLRN